MQFTYNLHEWLVIGVKTYFILFPVIIPMAIHEEDTVSLV